ncbi:hypothetical protein QFZ31_001641 [Neobacillus niacini]|jgi:hypothetical protein|nr:hypothetical protein [Neobacillus niacini]
MNKFVFTMILGIVVLQAGEVINIQEMTCIKHTSFFFRFKTSEVNVAAVRFVYGLCQ